VTMRRARSAVRSSATRPNNACGIPSASVPPRPAGSTPPRTLPPGQAARGRRPGAIGRARTARRRDPGRPR
jgi:hypothetical protein